MFYGKYNLAEGCGEQAQICTFTERKEEAIWPLLHRRSSQLASYHILWVWKSNVLHQFCLSERVCSLFLWDHQFFLMFIPDTFHHIPFCQKLFSLPQKMYSFSFTQDCTRSSHRRILFFFFCAGLPTNFAVASQVGQYLLSSVWGSPTQYCNLELHFSFMPVILLFL